MVEHIPVVPWGTGETKGLWWTSGIEDPLAGNRAKYIKLDFYDPIYRQKPEVMPSMVGRPFIVERLGRSALPIYNRVCNLSINPDTGTYDDPALYLYTGDYRVARQDQAGFCEKDVMEVIAYSMAIQNFKSTFGVVLHINEIWFHEWLNSVKGVKKDDNEVVRFVASAGIRKWRPNETLKSYMREASIYPHSWANEPTTNHPPSGSPPPPRSPPPGSALRNAAWVCQAYEGQSSHQNQSSISRGTVQRLSTPNSRGTSFQPDQRPDIQEYESQDPREYQTSSRVTEPRYAQANPQPNNRQSPSDFLFSQRFEAQPAYRQGYASANPPQTTGESSGKNRQTPPQQRDPRPR